MRVAIVGYGYLGKAYHKVFKDAVIYDEPQDIGIRDIVNKCDIAIVAVPTDLNGEGDLNMSIVEDVVRWLETPTILIKSALQPGTVDRLVKEWSEFCIDAIGVPNPLNQEQAEELILFMQERITNGVVGQATKELK